MRLLAKLNSEFSSKLLEEAKETLASSLFLLALKEFKWILWCRFGRTAKFWLPGGSTAGAAAVCKAHRQINKRTQIKILAYPGLT